MIDTISTVKKKTHSYKNIIITPAYEQYVAFLSKTYPGSVHDKKICDIEVYVFPDQADIFKDKGFQGFEPSHATSYQPKKKLPNEDVSCIDMVLNRVIGSVRVGVEHVIAGVKRCRIVKDIFRNYVLDPDDVMSIACGLHNFRVRHRSVSIDITPIDIFLNAMALEFQ